jgi:hypothetical protein
MKIEQRKIEMTASVQTEQISGEDEEKLITASSLDSLKALFPDLKKGNDDLLKVSFNVAVANLVNSNGHGILGGDAVACMENFLHKPYNIEHNSSMVIGHATNYGFSTFGDNKLIENVTGKYTKSLQPFNMALGGVVYKRADSYYADLIKNSSKKGNYWHGAISASWEILFDEYILAIGSKKLADAELIREDSKVQELTQYLADEEGGTGFLKDGTPIYRIVIGNVLPAGVGFTFTPAANVKGLVVEDEVDANKKTKSYSKEDECAASITLESTSETSVEELKSFVEEKFEEIKEQISQKEKLSVSKNRHMKITDIADITEDALKESLAASEIRNFIKEQLSAKNAEFQQAEADKAKEIAAKESEIAAKQAELDAQLQKVSDLEAKISSVETSLNEVQAAKVAMEQSIAFNERMQIVDEKFEIGDEQREVIAKQIKSLDEDGFNAWLNDFGKILAAKTVGDVGKTLSSASAKEEVPNAQETEEVSDIEKYKKSFAKVTISV